MLKKVLATTLALGASNAFAYGQPLVDVALVDRGYGTLQTYWSGGQRYVAGEPGRPYSVRLTNLSNERVLAVLSVDGVNAISGQTASPQQSGYVLEPYQSTEISGWRKDMRSVAQFVFTDKFDSYAAQTGRPLNVGVIGVATYREQLPYWQYQRREQIGGWNEPQRHNDERYNGWRGGYGKSSEAPASAESAQQDAAGSSAKSHNGYSNDGYAYEGEARRNRQQLGTGHGYRERSRASYTDFRRRSSQPDQIVEIFYDDHQALVERGIIPRRYRHYAERAPEAFPNGFVPDPYR